MFKSELKAATGIALGHPLTSSSAATSSAMPSLGPASPAVWNDDRPCCTCRQQVPRLLVERLASMRVPATAHTISRMDLGESGNRWCPCPLQACQVRESAPAHGQVTVDRV